METFYYVYSPEKGAPSHKHGTYDEAVKEAKRLAETSRDEKATFFVLEAKTAFRYKSPVEQVEIVEIPF